MSPALIVSLALVGAIGGFFAGLLGFGGGVVMFPLLYYVPPLLGLERLDAKTVAAVVITQVFFSTLVGGIAHLRSGRVHGRIALVAGISSAVGSFVGGVASRWTSERFLLLLFGVATLLVIAMMFLPAPSKELEKVSLEKVAVAPVPLSLCSFVTGHSHRVSWRGKFRLRSVADLCPQSPHTNCYREQPFYRDDKYLLRTSRQACHRPNTLAHHNGRGYRSQHRSAGWRENPPPAPHPHFTIYLQRSGRAHRR